jgi:hypothetical protein
MAEETYFSQGDVQVTNSRVVLGGKTYAMRNITSVTIGEIPPNRVPGIVLAVLGLCPLMGGFSDNGGALLVIGLIVIGLGIALAALVKTRYVVRLGSASGESDALTAPDVAYIRKIVDAINKAIVQRG